MHFLIVALARLSVIAAPAANGHEEPLGRMARRLFASQRHSRHRQVHTHARKNLRVRFNLIANLGRAWSFGRRHAQAVAAQRGISSIRQAADLLRLALVYRVDPATYYAHHLYDAPSGIREVENYVGRYEMKNGLYSLLCELRRNATGYGLTLSEKAQFSEQCRRASLPIVPVLAVVSAGTWESIDVAPGNLDRDLFVKPVRGRGAVGAAAYRFVAGGYRTKTGQSLTNDELVAKIAESSMKGAILVTRRLVNHPEIADLAGESLIAFRVFTCLTAQGCPTVTHAMLRTVSKLEPSWNTEEEFAAAVDIDSGRLGPICGDADLAPDAWWDEHPKSGAPVNGRLIENWPAIAAIAAAAHGIFNGRVVIGWDIALTPEGPVIIEGNSDADTHFLQRVHRQMIGRSRMAPLLRGHLCLAKRLLDGAVRP